MRRRPSRRERRKGESRRSCSRRGLLKDGSERALILVRKARLLTEDEKVRYATEKAIEVRRGGGSKDKGCLMS